MKKTMLGFLWVTVIGIHSLLAQNPATTKPPAHYLIVVDISFSMTRIAESVRTTVSNLVYTGIQRQMQPGDDYTIWTFNERIYDQRFPLLHWDPVLAQAMANNAAKFIKNQKCEKQTRLDLLLPELYRTVKIGSQFTVILISDGDDRFVGTPFDAPINAIYKEHYREMRRAKKPFITTLVAENGKFAGYTVSAAGEDIAFDDLALQLAKGLRMEALTQSSNSTTNVTPGPSASGRENNPAAEIKPATQLVKPTSDQTPRTDSIGKLTATNAPAIKSEIKPGEGTNAAPINTVKPPLSVDDRATSIKPESVLGKEGLKSESDKNKAELVAKENQTNITMAALTPREAAAAITINPARAPDTPSAQALKVGADANRLSKEPNPPPSIKPDQPVGRRESSSKAPALTTVPASKPQPANAPMASNSTTVAQSVFNQREYLILWVLLLAAGSGFFYWLAQRRRTPHQPSFISRSIDREAK